VTIDAQIEVLENLASIDAELAIMQEELGRENDNIRQKKSRLDELNSHLTSSRESLGEMERTRSEISVEVRQMGIQIERSREKMLRCRTEKETMAVQRELEELRKLVRDREVEIEKLGQVIEMTRADIASSELEHEQVSAEIGTSEGPALERCRELEDAASAKKNERRALAGRVKPALLSRYELIRKRRGTAIAFTTDGTCSACHIALPPMQFQQLMRREQLAQCPQCNRILYFRPVSSADADSQGAV